LCLVALLISSGSAWIETVTKIIKASTKRRGFNFCKKISR